jgi:LmbE family N-acetylglucosaminyl deacetylase
MPWIFLSPHFDDAALSCGGIIWEEVRRGAQVSIWTICAAPPPPGPLSSFAQQLHARWGTVADATEQRRQEDIASCKLLGAAYRHLDLTDCIYRRGPDGEYLYPSEESLSAGLQPVDEYWVQHLVAQLKQDLPPDARVVCPLTIGNHVDHQLTRAAAERLPARLSYYADYPYVRRKPELLEDMLHTGWQAEHFDVSEPALAAWQASVAAHASQVSTFWPDIPAMRAGLKAYWALKNATSLWRKGSAHP